MAARAPGADERPRVRRPRRMFARHQHRRRAARSRDDADVEVAHLRRERDPFAVRRPVRVRRVGNERRRNPLHRRRPPEPWQARGARRFSSRNKSIVRPATSMATNLPRCWKVSAGPCRRRCRPRRSGCRSCLKSSRSSSRPAKPPRSCSSRKILRRRAARRSKGCGKRCPGSRACRKYNRGRAGPAPRRARRQLSCHA